MVYVIADGSAQSIPAAGEPTIEFNTEITDVQNEFNPATYTFTAKKAGNYFVAAKITWADMTDGVKSYVALKKGATYLASYYMIPGATGSISGSAFGIVALAANDEVIAVCKQYGAGAEALMTGTNLQLYIHKLS